MKIPDTYDQVYSSPSNSSALSTSSSSSSSGYLMSPLDESGYLVPIVNLIQCCDTSLNKCDIKQKLIQNNDIIQLTRSQSTRSAYTTCSSNLTSSSSFYSHFNNNHRATICEKLDDDKSTSVQHNFCIKCNCRLEKSRNLNNHIEQVHFII